MKKLFPLICFLCLFAMPAFAQFPSIETPEDTAGFVGFAKPPKQLERQNVIKTSPVPFFVGQIPICGEIRITYERAITRHHSVLIGASYSYPGALLAVSAALDTTGFKISDYKINGIRGMLCYRCYPLKKKKEATAGFFFGPYISYNMVQVTQKSSKDYERVHYFNASMTVGYQIVKRNGFTFEFFGGLGYRRNFVTGYNAYYNSYSGAQAFNTTPGNMPQFLNHVKLALQINMGYAF